MKKNIALTLISFAVLKWDEVLFDLQFEKLFQLLLKLEANLLDQEVNEIEIELSRM